MDPVDGSRGKQRGRFFHADTDVRGAERAIRTDEPELSHAGLFRDRFEVHSGLSMQDFWDGSWQTPRL